MIPGRRARPLLAVLIVLGVLLGAALALPLLVDVNRYRPFIAGTIQEASGRSVTLGTMSFTLLPSPGLTVSPLKVSDSRRYQGRDALTAESLSIRLGLAGLLRGRATVRSIVLKRPTLTLIRDAAGRWNFDDLLGRASAAPKAGSSPAAGGPLVVAVRRARLSSGRIRIYDDAIVPGSRSEATIGPIDANISSWGAGEDTALDLSIGLGKSLLKARARLLAALSGGRLQVETEAHSLRAEDLVALLPWLGVARPKGLQVGGAIDLEGSGSLPLDRPEAVRFKGSLRLKDISYRDAGMTRPLQGLSGRVAIDGDRAVWEGFHCRAGASSFGGRLQVEGFVEPRVAFSLTSPRLDFNEIVATFSPGGATHDETTPGQRAEPPSGLLDRVSARGRLDVETVRFQAFDLSDVRASVIMQRSRLALQEMKGAFYGGILSGSGSVDLGRAEPDYALVVRMDGVEVNPALEAFDPGLKDLLRGRLTGNLDLTASGMTMDSILGTARGAGALEVTEGVLTSFSVLRQLAALLELAGGKGIGRETTPFESLRGHLAVGDRRARTEDLVLHSADLDLEGRGSVGLDATLDLDVVARFSEESTRGMVEKSARLEKLADQGRLSVYFTLRGDLASPRFSLNTKVQAREAGEQVKERAREKLRERLKDRLLEELGHEEQPD